MLEYEKQPCVVSLEEAALSRTGMARLPLHCARAPSWLTVRMERFAKEIVTIIFDRYGAERLPERISSPFWFQTFGCVLGYDWHSSGLTTLVTRARLKSLELQFAVEKEKPPRKLRVRLKESAEDYARYESVKALQYASRMSAEMDKAAVQAGYQLSPYVKTADNKLFLASRDRSDKSR